MRGTTWILYLALVIVPISFVQVCEPGSYGAQRWDMERYSVPTARADVTVFKYGPRIYFAGGRSSQTASSDVIDVLDASSLANNFTAAPLVLTPNREPYGNASVMEPITLTEPRYGATGVVLEDKGIAMVAGGLQETASGGAVFASSAVDIIRMSDSGEITNISRAGLSSNRTSVAATRAGNFVIFSGGFTRDVSGTTAYDTVDYYNVGTGTWAVSATPMWPARYGHVAVAVDDATVVFAAGGNPSDGAVLGCSMFRLNATTQTWGQYQLETGGNGLSVGRFNPVGLFIGGRVVIAGGMSGNTWSRRVDFFDAKRDVLDPLRWTSSEALSYSHRYIAGAAAGTLAIFASKEGVDIFDSVTSTWRAGTGGGVPLTPSTYWRAVALSNNRVIFYGHSATDKTVAMFELEGCDLCPAASTSPRGSQSAQACGCLPGYTGQNGSACSCCPPGHYKRGTGQEECIVCPAGSPGTISGARPTQQCNGNPDACCDAGEYIQLVPAAQGNSASMRIACMPPPTTTPPFESRVADSLGGSVPSARACWPVHLAMVSMVFALCGRR